MSDVQKTPIQHIYEGLAAKNPDLKEYGFDAFANDMKDENNLKSLYSGLAEKNPTLKETGFDSFKSDIWGEQSDTQQEQPLTYMQKELRARFPENYTNEQNPKVQPQNNVPKESGSIATELNQQLKQGTNETIAAAYGIPGYAYDFVGAGLRALGLDVPTYKESGLTNDVTIAGVDINPLSILDQAKENLLTFSKQNAEKVRELNPDIDKGVVEPIQNGEYKKAIRNLFSSMTQSAPASAAMMLSGGLSTPMQVGAGAALFGSQNLNQADQEGDYGNVSRDAVVAISSVTGALESIFETTFGSGAAGKAISNIIKKEGKEQATETIKKGFTDNVIKLITENPWMAPFGEAYEEMGTQLAQNAVNKYSGYKPDINLMDGVYDAGLLGFGMGSVHGGLIEGTKRIVNGGESTTPTDNPGSQQPTVPVSSDSAPQFTISPRQQAEFDLRSTASQFANNETGLLQTIQEATPDGQENRIWFIKAGQTTDPDGSILVEDEAGNSKFLTKEQIAGEPNNMTIDDFVNMKLSEYDQTKQNQELLKQKQIQIDGKQFILTGDQTNEGLVALNTDDGSETVVPFDIIDKIKGSGTSNANIVQRAYGKTNITGIKNDDGSITLTDNYDLDKANSLKEEIEKSTGGKATVQAELIPNEDATAPQQFQLSIIPKVNEPINNESVTSEPSGDNGLKAEPTEELFTPANERPVITQQIGKDQIDFVEGEDFDEVVASDKMPLEKALPILEKKFKDHQKVAVVAEKVQVEVPGKVIKGETKWDDDVVEPSTFKTVVKSIRIVPKEVVARQKQADTETLLGIIDEFNATPQSREDKQKAGEITAIAKKLGYQTDRNANNELYLYDQTGQIKSTKVSENANIENQNVEIVPENQNQPIEQQQIVNTENSISSQNNEFQNEESEKSSPNIDGQPIAVEGENTPPQEQGQGVNEGLEENVKPNELYVTNSGDGNGFVVKQDVTGWVILKNGKPNENGYYLIESPDGKGLLYTDDARVFGRLKIKPKISTGQPATISQTPGEAAGQDQVPEAGKMVDKAPAKKSNTITGKAKEVEVDQSDIQGLALQYFVNGGTVHPDEILRMYRDSKSERGFRRSYTSPEEGLTVAQIAHNIWESLPETIQNGLTEMGIYNEVEGVIQNYNTPTLMAQTLLKKYSVDQNQGYSKEWLDEQMRIEAEEEQAQDEALFSEYTELDKKGQLPTKNEIIELFLPENTEKNGQEIDSNGSNGTDQAVNPEGNDQVGQNIQGSEPGVQGEVEGENGKQEIIASDRTLEANQVRDVAGQDSGQRPAVKEPWQMTFNEYLDENLKRKENDPKLFYNPITHKYETQKSVESSLYGQWSKLNEQAFIDGKSNKKPAWAKTLKEHVDLNGKGSEQEHKLYIEQALSEGKPVPEEVLNDYPELQPRKPLNDILEDAVKAREEKKQSTPLPEEKQNEVRFRVASNPEDNNLVAVHNIKPEGLLNADRIGGLPMPSIAIIDVNHGFNSYGEITLIADKDFVDPKKNKSAKVFASDVYSARYPSINYQLPASGSKKLLTKIQSVLNKELTSSVAYNLEDEIQNRGFKDMLNSRYAKLLFLKDGEHGFDYSYTELKYPESIKKAFIDNGWKNLEYFELNDKPEVKKQLTDLYISQYEDGSDQQEIVKQRLLEKDGTLNSNLLRDFINGVRREIKEAGKIDLTETLRSSNNFIEKNKLEKEFETYARDLYKSLDVTEKIFKGFSNSGNRVYSPHTLENVLKEMKKAGVRGGETSFYGAGSVRAQVTPEFKSLKEIQNNRGSIQEGFDKVKEEASNELFEVLDAIRPFYKYDGSNFGYSQNAAEELVTLSRRGSSESFKPLTPELNQMVSDYLTKLSKLPTEYFEAKINRGVSLAEFKNALIPEDTSQDIRDILKFNGINAVEYTNNDDRAEKLKQITEEKDLRFRIIGEAGAANLDKAEEATTRLDNLAVAREMETSGKDAKSISLATGWEKGVDGKWRYETPDGNLKITGSKASDLEDIFDDPELYKAYPQLKTIGTNIVIDGLAIKGGSYTPFQDRSGEDLFDIQPEINVRANELSDVKTILIHEIQHAIQEIEGFARGGNRESAISPYYNSINVKLNDISKEIEKYKLQFNKEKVSELQAEYDKLMQEKLSANSYDHYKRLAGEVESRNVQTRMNMTPEERLNTLLSETEDVSREDQIVLMDGLGVSNLEGEFEYTDHQNLIDKLESGAIETDEVILDDNEGLALQLAGKISENDLNEIRNSGRDLGGFELFGRVYINSVISPIEVVKTWIHEKTHRQLKRIFPQKARREQFLNRVFDHVGEKEINATLPKIYHGDSKEQRAEEYIAFKVQEYGMTGNVNADPEIKKIIFELLNRFTTLKNIQDATRGINLAQQGSGKRNAHDGLRERSGLQENGRIGGKGEPNFNRGLRQNEGREGTETSRIKELSKQAKNNPSVFSEYISEAKKVVQANKSDLSLGEKPMTYLKSKDIEAGKPVTMTYLKNTEKAPYLGSRFGQDVEPSGFYFIQKEHDFPPSKGWVEGQITLNNPLVIPITDETMIEYKNDLSKKYGGKKKKALTNAIKKDGYDGIITTRDGYLGEMIKFDFDPSKLQPENTILIDGKSRSTLNSNGKPDSKLVYQDLLSRIGKKKFTDYLNENGLSEEEIQDALTGNDEYWIDQYLSDEYQVSVNSDGYVQFEELTPQVKKLIGNNKVLLYHHTSDAIINSISKDGIISTGANVNRNSYRNLGVYLTAEYSGNAVEGYKNRAWNFHGGNPITLEVSTTVDHLKPDDNDSDLKSGRSQFVVDKVKPEDIINLSEFKPKNTITINGVEKSTLNSNGKPIANSEEGIRNFWKWFGDSKVVDSKGRPLVVYHGTNADFSEFKSKTGRHFFSDNLNVAKSYRDDFVFKEDKTIGIKADEYDQFKNDVVENSIPIIEAYLKIENPKVKDYEGENWLNSPIEVDIDKSKDGLIANNIIDGNGISATTFIVFNPSQIKSATGNNGSFDPDNNNIRYRRGEVPLNDYLEEAARQNQEAKKTRRNLSEVAEGVREFIQDHDLPIRRLEEKVKQLGGKIADNMKPYRDMSLSYGRMETLYKNFTKEKFEPIIKTISKIVKSGTPAGEVLPYVICKHALERNPYMRAIELKEWQDNAEIDLKKWTDANIDIPQATKDRKVKEFTDSLESKKQELSKKDYSGVRGFDPSNNFETPDELAQEIVDEFERKTPIGLVDELWSNVKNATSEIVDIWGKGLTMSEEQVQQTKDRFKHFVPLRGWRHGVAKQLVYKKGEGFSGSLQRIKGRTSIAENPLAYIEQIAFKALGEQVDNEVKTSLLNLVVGNYSDDFQQLYRLKKAYYIKDGIDENGEQMWKLTTERPSEELFKSGDAVTKIYNQYQKLRTPSQAHEHEVYVKRPNGDLVVVMVGDMLPVAQAMNKKNTMYRNLFTGKPNDAEFWNKPLSATIGAWNNTLKGMYTAYNIVFPITNFMRDAQEASITQFIKGDNGHLVVKNYKNAFPAIIRSLRGKESGGKYDEMLKEFRETGGNTGYTHLKTPEQLEKEINSELEMFNRTGTFRGYTIDKARKALSAIEAWNQIFEDATRFSVYITSRDAGKSAKEAANDSKEASVNFNRKGKSSKAFDSVWAFWNVAIQSMQKNFKLAKDYPGRFSMVAGAWLALGFVEAMMNDAMDGDDDKDYYNISDYVRENYLIIPILFGDKKDKYLRIPLPQFWRGFKSAGSIAYDVMNGKMDGLSATAKGLGNFLGGLLPIDIGGFYQNGEFSMAPVIPTIIRPVYEVKVNRDYMGYTIAKEPFTKEQERSLAASGLGKDNVSPAIKFFTDYLFRAGGGDNETRFYTQNGDIKKVPGIFDYNPSYIEHLITGYTGGTGKFVTDVLTTAIDGLDSEKEVDFRNAPFINQFIKKIPEAKWKVIGEYYDIKSEGNESAFGQLKRSYFSQEDKTKYKEVAGSNYLNEYNAVVNAYDKRLTTMMQYMDYKTAEGSEDVINTMKDAIEAIKQVKQKYNKK